MMDFKTNEQLLSEAVKKGDRREVNLLIELGVDPNWRDGDGVSALHLAAELPDTGILEDILAHRRTKVDIRDDEGATPLHYAARARRAGAIEKLIAAKAVVDARDNSLGTSLMEASSRGGAEAVEILLRKGAQPNAQSDKLYTALHYAVNHDRTEVVRLLTKAKADPLLANRHGITPMDLARRKSQDDDAKIMVSLLSGAESQIYLETGTQADIAAPQRASFIRKKSPSP